MVYYCMSEAQADNLICFNQRFRVENYVFFYYFFLIIDIWLSSTHRPFWMQFVSCFILNFKIK